MSYRVDFDSLDSLYNSIRNQSDLWEKEINKLSEDIETLIDSSNMTGMAADNIKSYMGSVHMSIIGSLLQMINMHRYNVLLYKNDYQSNIDKSLHAVIEGSELEWYSRRLGNQKRDALSINEEVNFALRQIRDIFSAGYGDVSSVNSSHESAVSFLTTLDSKINSLEKKHSASDFTATNAMMQSLMRFIEEQLSYGRAYKTNFDVDKLTQSDAYKSLQFASGEISHEMDSKAGMINTAIENENERIKALQDEYEERQRKAAIIKGIVGLAALALTVATAGAAMPVAMAAGALGGAVLSGVSNLTNQYVEHGNILENSDEINWYDFGGDVILGTVTGAVSAGVGSGIGKVVKAGIGNSALGTALRNSPYALERIGGKVLTGSAEEVITGISTRGMKTFMLTRNPVYALTEAYDLKEVVKDWLFGAAGSGGEYFTGINILDYEPSYVDVNETQDEPDFSADTMTAGAFGGSGGGGGGGRGI